MFAFIIILTVISIIGVTFVLYRYMGKRQGAGTDGGGGLMSGLRLMIGPFPLSVAIHLIVLIVLIVTVHQQRGRELIMVNLEAGGGGGGGGDEMQDLDMPEVPMPDSAPQQMDQPVTADTSQAVGLANDYVRAAAVGGIGIGR